MKQKCWTGPIVENVPNGVRWDKATMTAPTQAQIEGEHEIEKLRRQRIEFDCRYTIGNVADLTGSHCPIDKPCLRCQNEQLKAALTAGR